MAISSPAPATTRLPTRRLLRSHGNPGLGTDRAFLVATTFLAATVLLTWFAIRPTAAQATLAQVSDDPVPVEV